MRKRYNSRVAILCVFGFLFFFPAIALGYGYIQGYIYDDSDPANPIEGAEIKTDTGVSNLSFWDGFYIVALPSGTYTITVSKSGYETQTLSEVTVIEGNTNNFDFILSRTGLTIEAVYPTLGRLGLDLEVSVEGSGFDENTRVSFSPDVGNQSAILGSWETPAGARGIDLSNNLAYIAADTSGLQIVDVSDPRNPQLVGSYDTPDNAYDVIVSGNLAYVADDESGLQIIDVSNPESPSLVGFLDTPGGAYGITKVGELLYIADKTSGLQIINVSDPQSPIFVGSSNTPGWAYDVSVQEKIAYIADNAGGLRIVDVDPLSPTYLDIIGSFSNGSVSRGVAIEGNIAYVANQYQGLQLIDVSNISTPHLIASIDTPGNAEGVTVFGKTAYVADSHGGIQIVDVSNPHEPDIVGMVDTPGHATRIVVLEGLAYVADWLGGFQIADVSKPTAPTIIGWADTPVYARDVCLINNTAYVADWNGGLQVIDTADPENPTIIGSIGAYGTADYFPAYGVDVAGSYAYIADPSNGLRVISIASPSNPQIVGLVDTVGQPNKVTVSDNLAYVADGIGGLQIFNLADPVNPVLMGGVAVPGTAYDVFISGTKAYLACHNEGMHIIDITSPETPILQGTADTPGYAMGVVVSDNLAYLADHASGMHVIDVSDSFHPVIISTVETSGDAFEVTLKDDIVYVAAGSGGLEMIDINDPHNPLVIGISDTPDSARAVIVSDSIAYVADYATGLVLISIPVEIQPVLVTSRESLNISLPTPPVTGHYTIRVFNELSSDVLYSAVSFTESLQVLNSKAVLVAGGGPEAPGAIWEETKLCANKAYDVLIQQGFDHDSVYYLSMETGNQFVDRPSLDFYLYDAINSWSADATELILFFVGHGEADTFILYADGTYRQTISSSELDSMLDTLQATMDGPVTFVYDACQSGTFISNFRPPDGKTRITITSASNEPAYFLNNGVESFSFQFWDKLLFNEGKVGYAFPAAAQIMGGYQTALVDADGDGMANENEDLSLASDIVIRRGSTVLLDLQPVVGTVSVADETLNGATITTIFADNVSDADMVIAQIIPPDINPDTDGIPITDLDSVELLDPDLDGTYEGIYDGFGTEGTYIIIVKAIATELIYSYVTDSMIGQNIYSTPQYAYITQTTGTANIEADEFEPDDSYSVANVIVVGSEDSQNHNFHVDGDVDWVRFYGIQGEGEESRYRIRTSNASIACNTIIELFAGDGTTSLAGPQNEVIEWTCLQNGIYYVKVSSANGHFGENVKYDLDVYLPIAGIPGELVGQVTDSQGAGIGGAVLTSDSSNATTISYPNGYYIFVLPSGYHTISINADGYEHHIEPNVEILAESRTTQDIVLYQPNELIAGDVNHDTNVTLIDAILSMQVIAGIEPVEVHLGADVNSDGKIGLEEILYIMHKEADLR